MSIATAQTHEQRIDEIRSYLVNARKKAALAAHAVRREADTVADDPERFRKYNDALGLDDLAKDIDGLIYGGLL